MGSDDDYPEEAPARRVCVDDFWIDTAPVTNRQFSAFVTATGYVTLAETASDPALYPGADPAMLRAGSSLFVPPRGPVSLNDPLQWWTFCFGADRRHPTRPDRSNSTHVDHPGAHIAYDVSTDYLGWSGIGLPPNQGRE